MCVGEIEKTLEKLNIYCLSVKKKKFAYFRIKNYIFFYKFWGKKMKGEKKKKGAWMGEREKMD